VAQGEKTPSGATARQGWPGILGLIAAWAWTLLAGGGGLMLLAERGPWPLTNGWFALCSGAAACPLTAWTSARLLGISISGRSRFAAAAVIWLAGQIARRVYSF
jgi:hypothetical protein